MVINIIIANDDFNAEGFIEYADSNPAIIDGDFVDGYFYSPQPFNSWSRFEGTWVSPKPYPQNGLSYEWNESEQEWDEINVIS